MLRFLNGSKIEIPQLVKKITKFKVEEKSEGMATKGVRLAEGTLKIILNGFLLKKLNWSPIINLKFVCLKFISKNR